MKYRRQFPELDVESMKPTRNAMHAYARVLGDHLKKYRPRRKHWWHASLRPSLNGFTSGVIHAETDFELAIDLRGSLFTAQTSEGAETTMILDGQSPAQLARLIDDFLLDSGVEIDVHASREAPRDEGFDGYSAVHADNMGRVLAGVNAAMAQFRSGIRLETSPIQLWPHHFDLSMLWLPGRKIEGQDPDDEEYSDKQMNFGFTFGDEAIPEPYFYVTAHPLPDTFPGMELPTGTRWNTDGFNGALLLYNTLVNSSDPHGYLLDLWATLLAAGRDQMCALDHSS